MATSSVYIMDMKGKVLISRVYRGNVSFAAADKFARHLVTHGSQSAPPIYTENGITYCYVQYNDLYLLAVTKKNANAMLIMAYLHKLIRVFKDYFGELEEESIRDNFVLIYELLDEMMDFGLPQYTESKILKNFICVSDRHKIDLKELGVKTKEITGAVSWRPQGIKHKKNEVFLDVIEKLNLLVSSNGTVLHSEILGTLKMKSFLSGMPELKLGLNDKLVMQNRRRTVRRLGKTIEMDDIRFHQCVRLSRFEHDRTISFIPPDGEFELMSYRLDAKVRPLIWIECHVEKYSHSRIEFMVKCKSEFKRRSTANNVDIVIPVPADADTPSFKASIGTVAYKPEDNSIVWNIKQLQGQKEYLMRAHFGLPSVTDGEEQTAETRPIKVNFEIPYFTVSGIQVRYLKIIEKSMYQALPWVRYITQNGDYQLRI